MIGEKIRTRRIDLGLSQEFIAEQLDVSRQAVSKWESGKSNPNTANLLELAKILKVDVSDFVEENTGSDEDDIKEIIDNNEENKLGSNKKKLGFLLRLFFIILGGIFFLAYTIVMTEVFKLDYRSTPWLLLTIYMMGGIFIFPEVYSRIKGLEDMDYFLFSKVLLPVIYLISPFLLASFLIKENI